jgi:hypothetical protein
MFLIYLKYFKIANDRRRLAQRALGHRDPGEFENNCQERGLQPEIHQNKNPIIVNIDTIIFISHKKIII